MAGMLLMEDIFQQASTGLMEISFNVNSICSKYTITTIIPNNNEARQSNPSPSHPPKKQTTKTKSNQTKPNPNSPAFLYNQNWVWLEKFNTPAWWVGDTSGFNIKQTNKQTATKAYQLTNAKTAKWSVCDQAVAKA